MRITLIDRIKLAGIACLLSLLAACNAVDVTIDPNNNEPDPTMADGQYTDTVYPIVLVHGLYGFKDIFGIDYFYKIPEALEQGGAEVYIVSVSGLESSTARGEQLLEEVNEVLALSGADKVHLMGHSHGSPTSRYVASVAPEIVASVTSVHGVNDGGSEAADALASVLNLPLTGFLWQSMFNALGNLIDVVAQDPHPQNAANSFNSLSMEGMDQFNIDHPQGLPTSTCGDGPVEVNGVRYYSWGGNEINTNIFDPLDLLIAASGTQIPGESDGMVSRCNQHLGEVIRDDYAHNHLDAMNWTVGLRKSGSANPLTLYRSQANRLKLLGL